MSNLIINPFSFGAAAAVSSSGFAARGATAVEGTNLNFENWPTEDVDTDSEFDVTSGDFTAAATGGYWFYGSCFPDTYLANGTFHTSTMTNVTQGRSATTVGHIEDNKDEGHSLSVASAEDLTASDVIRFRTGASPIGGGSWEYTTFGGFPLSSSDYFAAREGTGGPTPIRNYATEYYDVGGNFDPSTGVFTAPSTGLYLFSGGCRHSTGQDFTHGSRYQVNGVDVTEGRYLINDRGRNFTHISNLPILLELNASDTVEIDQFYFGGSVFVREGQFSGALVSPTHYFSGSKASRSGLKDEDVDTFVEQFDSGTVFNPTTGVFTAPADGNYYFIAHGRLVNQASVSLECAIVLEINGTEHTRVASYIEADFPSATLVLQAIVPMSAGDTANLYQANAELQDCRFSGMSTDA